MRSLAFLAVIAFAFAAAPVLAQEGASPAQGSAADDEQMLETIPVDESEGDDDDADLDEQVFYSGMGVSRVETDFANLGEAVNLDITLGFRIPTVKWFGIEIDIGQTVIPGDYTEPRQPGPACPPSPLPPTPGCGTEGEPGAFDPEGDEFAMQALGLSAAFKSTGRFYGLARYGYRYINTSNQTVNEADKSSTGFTVGGGYRWGRGLSGVEVSYKELAENIESLGLTFYVNLRR